MTSQSILWTWYQQHSCKLSTVSCKLLCNCVNIVFWLLFLLVFNNKWRKQIAISERDTWKGKWKLSSKQNQGTGADSASTAACAHTGDLTPFWHLETWSSTVLCSLPEILWRAWSTQHCWRGQRWGLAFYSRGHAAHCTHRSPETPEKASLPQSILTSRPVPGKKPSEHCSMFVPHMLYNGEPADTHCWCDARCNVSFRLSWCVSAVLSSLTCVILRV